MKTDIVHEHDVAFSQGRSEKLLSIGLEQLAVHWSFEHKRRGDTIIAQRSDERDGFPVAMRHLLDKPLTLRRPPVEAGNRRRNAGFIDEDKPFRIKPRLLLLQGLTRGSDVRPVLLGGSQTFF